MVTAKKQHRVMRNILGPAALTILVLSFVVDVGRQQARTGATYQLEQAVSIPLRELPSDPTLPPRPSAATPGATYLDDDPSSVSESPLLAAVGLAANIVPGQNFDGLGQNSFGFTDPLPPST